LNLKRLADLDEAAYVLDRVRLMSEDCVIRPASAADYEATCALFLELDGLHREQLPWLFRAPAERPRSQDHFGELLSSDRTSILLAAASSIVGLVTVRLQSGPDFGVLIAQRWGVIDDIVVQPSWRRRGIGARLARAAENWANGRGAAWLELGVYEFNAEARAFYEALGYVPVSTKLRRPLPGAG
jgi:GNAT superfamily N-acetyltransferase